MLPRLLLLTLLLAPAARAQPAADPAIFALAYTDITPTSARLVFTTNVPMQATAIVAYEHNEGWVLREKDYSQIHNIPITGLTEGRPYTVSIEARIPASATPNLKLEAPTLTPKQPTTKAAPFAHKTLIGTGHVDDVELAKKLNVGVVRVEATWEWLIPQKDQVNPANLDKLVTQVKAIKAAGMEPLILLAYGADWDQKYTNTQLKWRNRTFGPPDNVANWKFYVQTVMTALKGTAKYYEVWNEPDAGYFADGKPLERENVTDATGNQAFVNNNPYWLGDRYVPLVMATREIADQTDPDVEILAAAWNHDYHGTRGDLIFSRGANNYIQDYSFHNYVSQPHSYGKWAESIALYLDSAQKVFDKYKSPKPIAVTEWGIQTFDTALPLGDLSSRHDGQIFFLKSSLFYLAQERVKIMIVHQLGYNDAWSLVNKDNKGAYTYTPAFDTFSWICKTFSGKTYGRLPLTTDGGPTVSAYAISVPEDKAIYIATWQDRDEQSRKDNLTLPAKKVTLKLTNLPAGTYTRTQLNTNGAETTKSEIQIPATGYSWSETLPEATNNAESEIILYKLVSK